MVEAAAGVCNHRQAAACSAVTERAASGQPVGGNAGRKALPESPRNRELFPGARAANGRDGGVPVRADHEDGPWCRQLAGSGAQGRAGGTRAQGKGRRTVRDIQGRERVLAGHGLVPRVWRWAYFIRHRRSEIADNSANYLLLNGQQWIVSMQCTSSCAWPNWAVFCGGAATGRCPLGGDAADCRTGGPSGLPS